MKELLIKVWQGKVKAGQALNQLQDDFCENKLRFSKLRKNEYQILLVLEALQEKAINVREAEEEINLILKNFKRK